MQILRENDVNGYKADKKVVSYDITKKDNTLMEELNYDTKRKPHISPIAEVR